MRVRHSFFFALTLLVPVSAHASDALKAVASSYVQIQALLAADRLDGIKPAAHAIEDQAARMGSTGSALVKSASAIEGAADIKAAREAFAALSNAVIAAGDAEGWKDVPDLRVAFCPMTQKSW